MSDIISRNEGGLGNICGTGVQLLNQTHTDMAESLVIQKQGFLSSRNVGIIVVQYMLGTVRVCATLGLVRTWR